MFGTFLIITKIFMQYLFLSWPCFGVLFQTLPQPFTLQPRHLLAKYGSAVVVGWGMLMGGVAFSFIHQPWNFTGEWSLASIFAVIFVVLFELSLLFIAIWKV